MRLIKLLKFLILVTLGFGVLILLFYYVFLSESKIDLKNDPLISKWIGKEFEITKGVFICKPKDEASAKYHLDILPANISFPSSHDVFLYDPGKWDCFPNNHRYPLMPGEHFKITQIYRRVVPAVGDYLIIEAIILGGDYKDFEVSVTWLFDYSRSERPYRVVGPKEGVLLQLN